MNQPKPIDMMIVSHTRLATPEGSELVEAGTLVKQLDAETAMLLAGSGKARPATKDEVAAAAAKKPA